MAESRVGAADFAEAHHNEDSQPASSTVADTDMHSADSTMSQSHALTPLRGGTLKKRQSLKRADSMRRSGSRKGSRPGSIRSLTFADDVAGHGSEMNDAFFSPVPTSGSPTEILANRFQLWRKVLKDLITYFRDIQKSYETRSKSLYTLSNVITNITTPQQFATHGGIGDAIHILRDYHKLSIADGNKAKSVEEDVIVQLTGLRSDLGQKIKEIKSLSGDFKNNVDKETENTRRAVRDLQDALESSNRDPKSDPYLVRLAVGRQLGKQIEEENYLHRAFLNLESSGRELESIVMGEVQKAYNAYAGIIKREADEAYSAVEKLKSGPLSISKDHEWNAFVNNNEHFVDPRLPVRRVQNINYPGKDEAAASEVKAGMLERKSKYLKSYTPGWYVLSTTHLHEFKSPDRIASQAPVMSLALTDQKLGSHSNTDSTSHKFMLKGRQSGGIHRGHAWVFRAESYDTMLAWFEDIRNLTEKTGAERSAFIQRSHARSVSAGSHRAGSISSDGMEEDEADQVPYSATASQADLSAQQEKLPERPQLGGSFLSALKIDRNSQVALSPSSNESSGDHEIIPAAGALPSSDVPFNDARDAAQDEAKAAEGGLVYVSAIPSQQDDFSSAVYRQEYQDHPMQTGLNETSGVGAQYADAPAQAQGVDSGDPGMAAHGQPQPFRRSPSHHTERHDSRYGDWMGSATAEVGGGMIGAAGIKAYRQQQDPRNTVHEKQPTLQVIEPQNPASAFIGVSHPVGQSKESVMATTPITDPTKNHVGDSDQSIPLSRGASAHWSDPAEPIKRLAEESERPAMGSRVDTISDLHLPGEYPRSKIQSDS